MTTFLYSYQDIHNPAMHATWVPFAFFFLTLGINFWIVGKGVQAGIERLAKIGMPRSLDGSGDRGLLLAPFVPSTDRPSLRRHA